MENTLSQRIKMLRSHFDLTQTEFARKIEITMQSVSSWERGLTNPRKSDLKKVVKSFGINKEWLIDGKGEMLNSKVTVNDFSENRESIDRVQKLERTVSELKDEIFFIKTMLKNIALNQGTANFKNASVLAGVFTQNIGRSVRA